MSAAAINVDRGAGQLGGWRAEDAASQTSWWHPDGAACAYPEMVAGHAESGERRWAVYITIGLSGACALGAEVIWTRLLGMMLGTTVYVFSIILAVFLVGLAMGTALAAPGFRARCGRGWRWAGVRFCSRRRSAWTAS